MELTLSINDKLKLYTKVFLAPHHNYVVNLLYQPIIGVEAVNLYFTLWNFINIEKKDLIISHRQLLTFFNYDLNKLVSVRNKLEAIDLLHVYYQSVEGYYIYELRQPLSAKQFFLDSNLNVYLLYALGDNMYEYLESKFIVNNLDKSSINITKNFNDVFKEISNRPNILNDAQYVTNSITNINVPLNYDFDYELFLVLLSNNFINVKEIDEDVKRVVLNEAALYNFDAQMMSKIVLESTNNQKIDLDKLHIVARNYYKRLGNKALVESDIVAPMTEKQFYSYVNKKAQQLTNKEKALRSYKTKTPHEWLRILQNHTEVPSSYLEVVRVLFDEYKLASEVINVLIEFVRERNDGRLPLEYSKTIASSWNYKKIKTAEEAMQEVENIKDIEVNYQKRGEIAPTYVKAKRVVDEPSWLKSHQEQRQNVLQEEDQVDIDELKKLLESFK